MTEEQRRERDANLARVMTLLVHSSGCRNVPLLQLRQDERRVWMLLQVHAKQCKNSGCPVPRCCDL
ncbi:hypothetical protein COCSUDRAFT_63438 [Coccomyxa subellipsoidea C-169]|uniref:TAZ-type domain-containing protein n=1 Tax=Coccomyxa subellipsoidea (strain C-169) TaxID=574566 RepID=I0YXD7_COCSC|nr:hypothetical protein COCSUDRAFT_63438 [Coccomyxa subellipsoidea C-169]EIE23056.1 hypothetical protein COCSUDRAFT_63438 [Coccomyxa subellipsoidea C-169]|eukprot:XP_005647600.1 hypothetical protein COCSUDRAFT_63438 [Coccomyxa subellipsoidea C-169]